jgi:hypothetical protein
MGDEYRDALAAAQRRIEQLEGELAAERAPKTVASTPQWTSGKLAGLAVAFVLLVVTIGAAMFVAMHRVRHAPDPVSVTAMQSGAGWMVTFHLPPDVKDVSYRIRGDREYTDLGTMPWATDQSGRAMPLLTTTIPFEQAKEPTELELRYTRADGTRIGPALVSFSPMKEDVASTKAILTMMGQWVEVKKDRDGALVYFTTLLVYRHAFQRIEYGADEEEPTTSFAFTPSDRSELDSNDQMFVRLPIAPKFVTVRVTYRDGTKSAIKRFYPSPTQFPQVDSKVMNIDPSGY